MAFWHRYPQTNFHELNADWILEQLSSLKTIVDEFTERVIAMEDDVQDLKDRMTQAEEDIDAAEGRLDTVEGDIADLKDADIALDGRLDALEGADIQGATMLSDMTGVTHGVSSVTVGFKKNTYTNGAKGADVNDNAEIFAATTEQAGVMVPGDKAKLNAFSVDGSGNATFTGTVGGSAPAGNGDFATKQYVDNLAISGQASPVHDTNAKIDSWSAPYGTMEYDYDVNGVQYGSMRQVQIRVPTVTLTGTLSSSVVVARCHLDADYKTKNALAFRGEISAKVWRNDAFLKFVDFNVTVGYGDVAHVSEAPDILIQTKTAMDLQIGDEIAFELMTAVYMVA